MNNRFRPTKDTFQSTRQAIARRILASPLASAIGYPDEENPRRDLQAIADGLSEAASTWSYVSVTFRRGGTNIDLTVSAHEESPTLREYTRDAEGNDYTDHRIVCTVNWPCHGSTPVGPFLARVELYRQVALLGAEIEGEFGGAVVWRLVQTKEQREKKEVEAAALRAKNAAIVAMESVKHGFRAGAPPRNVSIDLLKDVPDGTYEHEFADGKKFVLTVKRHPPSVMGATDDTVMGVVARSA